MLRLTKNVLCLYIFSLTTIFLSQAFSFPGKSQASPSHRYPCICLTTNIFSPKWISGKENGLRQEKSVSGKKKVSPVRPLSQIFTYLSLSLQISLGFSSTQKRKGSSDKKSISGETFTPMFTDLSFSLQIQLGFFFNRWRKTSIALFQIQI